MSIDIRLRAVRDEIAAVLRASGFHVLKNRMWFVSPAGELLIDDDGQRYRVMITPENEAKTDNVVHI